MRWIWLGLRSARVIRWGTLRAAAAIVPTSVADKNRSPVEGGGRGSGRVRRSQMRLSATNGRSILAPAARTLTCHRALVFTGPPLTSLHPSPPPRCRTEEHLGRPQIHSIPTKILTSFIQNQEQGPGGHPGHRRAAPSRCTRYPIRCLQNGSDTVLSRLKSDRSRSSAHQNNALRILRSSTSTAGVNERSSRSAFGRRGRACTWSTLIALCSYSDVS